MKKPAVENQGKVVVERDDPGYLMMFPDGTIENATSKKEVERKAKAWFKEKLGDKDAIGVGRIEWR